MADAYKLKADASFPEPLTESDDVYAVLGRNYAAGDYVLARALTKRDRERAENGDLDHLLEPASMEDAEVAGSEKGLFIPEHEAESVALLEYGHQIVPRDQLLELASAGAEEAGQALEAAKEDGADERPALKLSTFPSLAEVSNDTEGSVNNVPQESEPVDEELLQTAQSSSQRGVEQPPGIQVGPDKAAKEADPAGGVEAPAQAPTPKRGPGRPRKQRQQETAQATEAQQQATEQAKAKQESEQ